MTASAAPITMLTPDFPFEYRPYLSHPAGIGSIPDEHLGTEVAIIGGGVAGLVTALELMKLGLRPVIYEAAAIGGRLRGVAMPDAGGPVADLGGMRFPLSSHAFWHYAGQVGTETEPFPNPLSPASPSTVLNLAGQNHEGRTLADLPVFFRDVFDAWVECLEERAEYREMQDAIRNRDLHAIKAIWDRIVPEFDDMCFSAYLATSKAFGNLTFEHREAFGQIGFGSGGWDVSFPNSILEILRVVYMNCEEEHQRIVGGAESFARGLWTHAPETMAHWAPGTTVESLHDGQPLGAVRSLRRVPAPDVGDTPHFEITDEAGTVRTYPSVVVTCHKAVLSSGIRTEEDLFDPSVWMAMRRAHYLPSTKIFVAVDRPFWFDVDPRTGRNVMGTTLTDRVTRGTYLFDNGPDQPALICLSYTWCDDSQKWLSLCASERAEVALRTLREIYPGVDIASHIIGEPESISWEDDPNFMGAFKINLPGHYRYQRRLYSHFVQESAPADRRGVFLAGDDVSWTAGWIDGAITTGVNAVWAVMNHFGGRTHPDNPGPGDRFAELGPVELP